MSREAAAAPAVHAPTPAPDAAVKATLTLLKHSKIKFVRVDTSDSAGTSRGKAMVLGRHATAHSLAAGFNMVECIAGLPLAHDAIAPGSGLSASGILTLMPDFDTLRVLPTDLAPATAAIFGTLVDPATMAPSDLCPRQRLRETMAAAEAAGLRFTVGAEVEFRVTPVVGGPQRTIAENWSAIGPMDENGAFLEALESALDAQGVELELAHTESAPGQLEVVLRHADPIGIADRITVLRETLHAVAAKHGLAATLAPKTDAAAAGAGMHMHFGVTDLDGRSVFGDADSDHGLSATGSAAMAGVLKHLGGLLAVTTPSTNSFRRLAPGCWSGAHYCWGVENKEAPIRLCAGAPRRLAGWHGAVEHFELKTVDGTCNPYHAATCTLRAALDGIASELVLPCPVVGNPAESASPPRRLPETLEDALDLFEKDEVLTAALGRRLAQAYVAVKRYDAGQVQGRSMGSEANILIAKGV